MTLDECYAILELDADATFEDAQEAYELLAAVWNPDGFPADSDVARESEKRLRRLSRAYDEVRKHLAVDLRGAQMADPLVQQPSCGVFGTEQNHGGRDQGGDRVSAADDDSPGDSTSTQHELGSQADEQAPQGGILVIPAILVGGVVLPYLGFRITRWFAITLYNSPLETVGAICGILVLLLSARKFWRDNAQFFATMSQQVLATSLRRAFLFWMLYAILLVPAILVAYQMDRLLDAGITRVRLWGGEDSVTVSTEAAAEQRVTLPVPLYVRSVCNVLESVMLILHWQLIFYVTYVVIRSFCYVYARVYATMGNELVFCIPIAGRAASGNCDNA